MATRIVIANPADVPAMAAVLARAFARDPMVVWPMVTEDDLPGRIRHQFELVDGLLAARGWMHRTEDGAGVMALLPPDADSEVTDAAANAGMARIAPDGGERYARFWAWIESIHPAEPHWLLDQVAVDPAAQGRGIGTALIRHAIERATADGLPLLLETGVPRNVGLYRYLGFSVMHEASAPGDGPVIWFMRHDPVP